MKKALLNVVVLLLLYAAGVTASDWTTTASKVLESIVHVQHAGGACTGFVIDTERRYILTADHCWGKDELMADKKPAVVVARDTKKDLMVLRVEETDRPALKLAAKNPAIGDEVASYGYGYDLERPLFRRASISDDDTYIPEGGIGGPFLVIDAAFVGGQSGGCVVNLAGEVVMIVQRGTDRVGLGIGAEQIKKSMGRYFAKQP